MHTCAVIGPANIREVFCSCDGQPVIYRFSGQCITILCGEKLELDENGVWWVRPIADDPEGMMVFENVDVNVQRTKVLK